MRPLILLFALCLGTAALAGDPYPTDYFRNPVGETLRLSGTFGELRPGHFHSGIDIKGYIGQTLYAAAGGYVSRIQVNSGGYGKALYLTHPNGYTTVYAHLHNFTPELEAYVKKAQYEKETFDIRLYPGPDAFTFQRGDPIGAMGVSGNSFGPHLHFEIRNSRNAKPINPLLFGMPFEDADPPRMHQLRIYALDDKLHTIEARSYELTGGDGVYRVAGDDPIAFPAWRAGFALEVYDHMNNGANRNGVYKLEMLVDGQPAYTFDLETFAFSETRYANAHLDFERQVEAGDYLHRFYRLAGNRLSIYDKQIDRGAVKLFKDKPREVLLRTEDAYGNRAELRFAVRRASMPEQRPARNFDYHLPYGEESVIDNVDLYVRFPSGAFYEDVFMRYRMSRESSGQIYSNVHGLHEETTPLHRAFELRIRPTLIPDDLRDKAFIAKCGPDGEVVNCGGTWKGAFLATSVRGFGDYCIMADTVPPTIAPQRFAADMRGYDHMAFHVADDLPSSGEARGLQYEGRVNGEWVLMEYDAKNDRLVHRFDGRIKKGDNTLVLRVRDSQGNTTVWRGRFTL